MASLNETFINRIREFLGNRSPYWLSKQSNVSEATISRILSGKLNPTLKVVEQIAEGLNVPPEDLLKEDQKSKEIPGDIVSMLYNQENVVYDAIRGILKPLSSVKKTK